MAAVITIVSGAVEQERQPSVVEAYQAAIADGIPEALETTFLTRDGDGLAVVTVWRSRDVLDAYIATGEEPLARRLMREAGATPTVRILEVLARA